VIDMANPIPSQALAKRQSRRPHIEPLALDVHDLADMLRLSPRTIYSLDASGSIGPVALRLSERILRWDRAQVEAWWAACRAAGRCIGRREWLKLQGALR